MRCVLFLQGSPLRPCGPLILPSGAAPAQLERQEERKQRRMALARAKRKMGPLRYYLCPLQRARFIKKAGFDTQDDALVRVPQRDRGAEALCPPR